MKNFEKPFTKAFLFLGLGIAYPTKTTSFLFLCDLSGLSWKEINTIKIYTMP
jgi:hypothetical protein